MSIGVTIAAIVICIWPEAKMADSICTFLFSVIVCMTVTPLTKQCLNVMMEAAPKSVNSEKLIADIRAVCQGDVGIHDFHVWSISVNKYAISAHTECENPEEALMLVHEICKNKYKIDHCTFQIVNPKDERFKFICDHTNHKQWIV